MRKGDIMVKWILMIVLTWPSGAQMHQAPGWYLVDECHEEGKRWQRANEKRDGMVRYEYACIQRGRRG